MGKGGNQIMQPNAFLRRLSWPNRRRHRWCPDAYVWWPQLPSSAWHPTTSSRGYDRPYQGGIGRWWWDAASKSKKLPDHKIRLPIVWTDASKEDYHTAATPWGHLKPCSWSLCRLRAKHCCRWGCGLATRARSHCESSRCRLFGQWEAYKQPPCCKLVVVQMECTGLTVVHGFALSVVNFLALWRVDGWVKIWSFLVRFWVSFWCFVYFRITSFIFMHAGLCWEFKMLGLIVEMLIFGNGIEAATGHRVWLSWNW